MTSRVKQDEHNLFALGAKVDLSTFDFSQLLKKNNNSFDKVEVNNIFEQPAEKAVTLADLMELSYDCLKQGSFDKASAYLQQAVFIDLESNHPSAMLKCSDYWAEKKRRMALMVKEQQADFLTESYAVFIETIVNSLKIDIDRALFYIKMWVFSSITATLEQQLLKGDDIDLYLKLARSYKKKGDYDKAIDAYSYGLSMQRDNVSILVELADCYAITDEESNARILFREAFFCGAEKVDFNYLESAMILNLKKRVEQMPIEKEYLNYWIAVYGVVYGVFCLSRELRPLEYTRLNQSIHILRSELDEKGDRKGDLKPRLINRLFWLIDYHRVLASDTKLSQEVIKRSLIEIRFLDERIYRQYKI